MNWGRSEELEKPPRIKSNPPLVHNEYQSQPFDYSNFSPKDKYKGRSPQSTQSRQSKRRIKLTPEFQPDISIDLHGETRESAIENIRQVFRKALVNNYQTALVITDKGLNSSQTGGILPNTVRSFLEQKHHEGALKSFQPAPSFLGGRGAILIHFF